MANIKKGDLVQLISGRSQARGGDRGKQGRVLEVQVERNRVVVEGLNFVTKHVKVGQTQRGTKTGGIESREAPIHVSNVQLVNPDTKQPARVGFTVVTDDKGKTSRVRYFKASRRIAVKATTKSAKATASDAAATESDSVADDVVVEAPVAKTAAKAAVVDAPAKAEKPAKAKAASTASKDAE